MKKIIAIGSVLLGLIFLAGCGQQQTSQTQPTPPYTATQTTDETASWKTHQNEKFGIEFKYPKNIPFDNGSETSNGWYTVGGNYDYSGDNYFNFTVLDKTEGMENINSLKYRDKNLFAPNELYFQNGKFIQVDGYGTANYYFVDAYYEGKDYVYHFMMSRPNHSDELLELFEKILTSAKLTK